MLFDLIQREYNWPLETGFLKVGPSLNSFPIIYLRTLLEGRCHWQPRGPCEVSDHYSIGFKAVTGNSHKVAAFLHAQIWLLGEQKVKVLVAQSCPTLCDPVDCNPPESFVHGILQARILEWVAFSFFRGSSWPRDPTWVSQADFYHLSHQGSHLGKVLFLDCQWVERARRNTWGLCPITSSPLCFMC